MDFFHITVSARTPPLWLHSVFLMLVGIYWRWPELKSLLIMEETELSKIYFLVLFFSGG